MLRFLASTVLYLLANAVGLFVASLLLDGFHIDVMGFIVSLLFFTIAGIILGPFILKMSLRYIPALSGGIALVTTFVGLFLTTLFTDGLTITGVQAWIIAPLIIWVVVLLAGILLPLILFKKVLQNRQDKTN